MRYSPELKEAVLKKIMPPHKRTVKQLAIEEGISEATLYNWRQEARSKGIRLPDGDKRPRSPWATRPARSHPALPGKEAMLRSDRYSRRPPRRRSAKVVRPPRLEAVGGSSQ